MMTELATLAGGCFWCTEAIFKRLKGIESVIPGYAGGKTDNPSYHQVSSGNTGYAESIQITFNPDVIPYEKILDVFWHTHNPTTPNKQGHDVGSEYRSMIFYHNENQKRIAGKSKQEFQQEGVYQDPIVTEIIPFTNFYPADEEHKDYYEKNRFNPYCTFIINPKIQKLLKEYKKEVKDEYK